MKLATSISVAALALVVAAIARPAGSAERGITLNEAFALALAKNEGLTIERESLRAANAGVSGARGAYDPVLDVEGAHSRSRVPVNSSFSGAPAGQFSPETKSRDLSVGIRQLLPTGGAVSLSGSGGRQTTDGVFARLSPVWATRVGVEVRQPLLRNLMIDPARLSVRVAKAGRKAADASLRRVVTETVAATEQAYWALAAARQGVAVREEAVRLAEEQLAQTRTRVQSGTSPETEAAQPRAEVERRRGELLEAREALSRTENSLKLLIFSASDDSAWLDSINPADSAGTDVAPVDLNAAMARAQVGRPELNESAALVDRRRAEAAFARSGVWPALDAVASYDRFGLAGDRNPAGPADPIPSSFDGGLGRSFGMLGDNDFNAVRVALVLELPVINRSARADAAIARSAQRQAEAALERTRKTIRAEVLDAAAKLETAGQRIEAARSGREAAEIQLAAERDRFSTGLSTNFLVLTRQNDLSLARLAEISALTDYRVARSEMARATGSLIEDRGIDVRDTLR